MTRGCDAWVKAMATKATSKKRATAQKKQPKKIGRPSKYTPELVAEICERLSKGEPLAVICRSEGMPTDRTVRDWVVKNQDVSSAIAHARESGEDWLAAECLNIADTPLIGVTEKLEKNEETGGFEVTERRHEDMLGHRKLQIDTRLKLLAKWNPKKWGDKLQHADADGGKIETPTFILAPVRSVEGG
jgi:hypothetical protein